MIFVGPSYFPDNDGTSIQNDKTVNVNKGEWDKGRTTDSVNAFRKKRETRKGSLRRDFLNVYCITTKRIGYLFNFQVTPSLVSFTSKPAWANASRIWSLVAQSFSALALARRASTMSTTLP